jgi:hypothetical protein
MGSIGCGDLFQRWMTVLLRASLGEVEGRVDFTCVFVQDGCTYRHGTESESAVRLSPSKTGGLRPRPGVSVTGRASLSNSGRVVGLLIRVIMTHFSRQTRS